MYCIKTLFITEIMCSPLTAPRCSAQGLAGGQNVVPQECVMVMWFQLDGRPASIFRIEKRKAAVAGHTQRPALMYRLTSIPACAVVLCSFYDSSDKLMIEKLTYSVLRKLYS